MSQALALFDASLAEALKPAATWLKSLEIINALKFSRYGYALINTAHVLGIALLVGAILPLDLRLMGAWRGVERAALARVLAPVAAAGLILAVLSGAVLFAVRATDYIQVTLFAWKFGLIALGATLAILLHIHAGWRLEGASDRRAAFHGAASMASWLGVLVCGRMIAYFPG